MLKLLTAFLLCAVQIISGAGSNEQKTENNLTFGVFADVHSNSKYFDRTLDNIFTLTNNGETLDGVIMIGDIIYTYENQTPSYDFVTANKHFKKLSQEGKIISAMGNHEFPIKAKDSETVSLSKKLFEQNMGVPPENDAVYDGYHFITVGPNTYFGELSSKQEEWAIDRINNALSESEDKPVFLIIHHPIDNTIYGSYDKNRHSNKFEDFIKSQPRLIVLCAHKHYSNSDPHSIYQVPGGATFLYTSVVYTTVEQKMSYATEAHDDFSSQALILNIDRDTNVVTVKRFYIDANEPTYLEGGDWIFDIPAMVKESKKKNVSAMIYKYTENRAKFSVPPYFIKGSNITVNKITDTSVKISFPAACSRGFDENSFVAYYKIDVYDCETGEQLKSVKIISDFFVKNKRDVYSAGVFDIPSAPKWRITVTPVTTWYVEGDPISTELIPAKSLFKPVEFDEKHIYEVIANDITKENISGEFNRKNNGIYVAQSWVCTLGYTFNVEEAGTYRIFIDAAARNPVETTMTFGIGKINLFTSKVILDTGSYINGFYKICADIEIDEPGKYTVKFQKNKSKTSIRVYGIKLARHSDE